MSTEHHDDETSSTGTRRLVLQGGLAAAALALFQASASAGPTLSRGTSRMVVPKNQTLDGLSVLRSLEGAGLDPKRLDLKSILGNRSDIEELNGMLHGAAGMRKANWDGFTVVLVEVSK